MFHFKHPDPRGIILAPILSQSDGWDKGYSILDPEGGGMKKKIKYGRGVLDKKNMAGGSGRKYNFPMHPPPSGTKME